MAKSSSLSADLALLEPFWRETIERVVLPNGVTLLLKADPASAIASVQVWVKTGSIHEGTKLGGGLSHYLEHMLFKGTERRAGREISATIQAHGGYINAYTTFDRTVYYIDIPANHATVAVDVLADTVLHSTLPADEVEKEKQVILREIAMGQDDPDTRFYESFFDTAYRVHPFRLPVIGAKGYSLVLPPANPHPKRSIYLIERKVAVNPHRDALRIAGTLELVRNDFSINTRRVDVIVRGAKAMLNIGEAPVAREIWRGLRPCTPDGMPAIGRARGRGDVWLATGHQMTGLKTAPGTGLLLAQLMTGETPRFDPEPFRADRY